MSGKKQGRTSKRDITLFKSAGMAIVDLAVASLLFTDIK
jgi:ornithine cyclodeaminase/alanine dehydrogenase-like protein (mu-crystallin family)